jgi:hypothetical protein
MNNEALELLLGIGIVVILFTALIGIVVAVLYLLNLQNLLKIISPENRVVEPSNVWLMLIPLFNLVYAFILYPKISESVKNEFLKRGLADGGDYGKSLGTAMAVLGLCGFIPVLGGFASIAHLVIWIIYWVKMSEYKSKLS